MHRIVGVIIFILGLLLAVLSFLKILPGALQTGILAILIGAVVFGLSFVSRPVAGADAPPPLSLTERVTAIFYEPARIFQNLHWHPRWLAAFLVMAICSAIYHAAFVQRLTPEVVALAPIEKTIEGGWISADKADQIREQTRETAQSPLFKVTGPLSEAGSIFLFEVLLAAIFLVLALIFGGQLTFWQALCVAMYSSLPVVVVEKLISLLLLYIKSPDDIDPIKVQRGLVRADLGILFSPAEHPYLYVLASFFGLLTIYRLWLAAIGLRYTGQKISSASSWTIVLILWALGLLLSVIAAALFPTFVT